MKLEAKAAEMPETDIRERKFMYPAYVKCMSAALTLHLTIFIHLISLSYFCDLHILNYLFAL